MGLDAMIFVFWMLSFKPAFSLSSFTFIKRLFSSSLLSAIRVVSSAYLRLLIFLPAILILACTSSSLTFHMMYSAYKLNKQSDNIQPWRTPFPIWNQFVVLCLVLTVVSWPAYRFLRIQVKWAGIGGRRWSKNTGVSSLSLLQGNFLTHELNWGLLDWGQIPCYLSDLGSPNEVFLFVF